MSIKPSQYKILQPFEAWVQQTLPAIYDDSLSYDDLLAKMLAYINSLVENNTALSTDMKNSIDYINNYFDNLDVQDNINKKLDIMAEDGTLNKIINQEIFPNLQARTSDYVIFIGDSYGVQNSDGDIRQWYWQLIASEMRLTEGVNFFKSFQSGAGFQNGEFMSQLQTLVTQLDKDKVSKVCVFGGWNDSDKNANEVLQAMVDFATYCYSNFKNMRDLCLGHISWGRLTNTPHNRNQLQNSLKYYQEYGNACGFRFITNSQYILHKNNVWQTDGAHPNPVGQLFLGRYLYSGVKGGSCDVRYKTDTSITSITLAENVTSLIDGANTPLLLDEVNNNLCTIQSYNPLAFNCDYSNIIMDNLHYYNLFSCDLNYCEGLPRFCVENIAFYIVDDTNHYHPCVGQISLEKDMFAISGIATDTNGTDYFRGNIAKILLPPFTIKCDSILC